MCGRLLRGGDRQARDRRAFGRKAVRALTEAFPGSSATFDEAAFEIHMLDPEVHVVLASFHRQVGDGSPVDQVLQRLVAGLRETQAPPPATFAEAREILLPRLVHRLTFEGTPPGSPRIPSRPVGDRIVMTLALDRPTMVGYVTEEVMATWHVPEDELFAVALRNLRTISSRPLDQPDEGLWESAWEDSWDASRLLLWPFEPPLRPLGEPVVLVPEPGLLLLTGSADPGGLATLLEAAREALSAPKVVCCLPLVLREGSWDPLVLPPDHEHYAEWNELRVQVEGSDYASQAGLLEARLDREGEDLWVAKYNALQTAVGLRSWTTWGEGAASLLPRTDLIGVMSNREGHPSGLHPWEAVARAVGDRLAREPDCWPPRYRVTTFPAPEEVAAFGPPEVPL